MTLFQVSFDVVRYWTDLDDRLIREEMTLVFDPTDWRSFPLPNDLWAIWQPALEAAIAESMALTGLDPEEAGPIYVASNDWMLEQRVITGCAPPEGQEDPILVDSPQDQTPFWDFLGRAAKPGITPLTLEQYINGRQAVLAAARAAGIVYYQDMIDEMTTRRATLVAAIGEPAADIILSPIPTLEFLVANMDAWNAQHYPTDGSA